MMTNKRVKQSFESITPTSDQKERMLANILEQKKQKPKSNIISFNQKTKPFLAVAASLIIVTSGALVLTQIGNDTISHSAVMPEQHQGSQNFIEYNGREYVYGEELKNLSKEDLIGPLNKIENFGDDIDVIWELKGYNPTEVIVLEHLGSYYLCKNINQ